MGCCYSVVFVFLVFLRTSIYSKRAFSLPLNPYSSHCRSALLTTLFLHLTPQSISVFASADGRIVLMVLNWCIDKISLITSLNGGKYRIPMYSWSSSCRFWEVMCCNLTFRSCLSIHPTLISESSQILFKTLAIRKPIIGIVAFHSFNSLNLCTRSPPLYGR